MILLRVSHYSIRNHTGNFEMVCKMKTIGITAVAADVFLQSWAVNAV